MHRQTDAQKCPSLSKQSEVTRDANVRKIRKIPRKKEVEQRLSVGAFPRTRLHARTNRLTLQEGGRCMCASRATDRLYLSLCPDKRQMVTDKQRYMRACMHTSRKAHRLHHMTHCPSMASIFITSLTQY